MKKLQLADFAAEYDGTESLLINPDSGEVLKKCGLRQVSMDIDFEKTPEYSGILEREKQLYQEIVDPEIDKKPFDSISAVANGGMGILKMATELGLDREIAMKVIIPELKTDDDVIRAFLREAVLTAQLQHPNIAPIYRLGFLEESGLYYTMRYVSGETLGTIITNLTLQYPNYVEKYDYYELLEIFMKVCQAVAYAHTKNVIHRDIKPGNIMIGNYGDVLLLDWGLAKRMVWDRKKVSLGDKGEFVNPAYETLMPNTIKASPAYMAPEQAIGSEEHTDQRTDIFLLGSTLYHMFTHRPPYAGRDLGEIIKSARKVKFAPPDSREFVGKRIPQALCNVIKKAMSVKPEDRYQNVEELIKDVEDVLHDKMDFDQAFYKPGDTLMTQGDIGHSLYYILSGEVVVFTTGKLGMTRELERVGPGEVVGELALISEAPRVANVKAVKPTEALILSKDAFKGNLEKMPPWFSRLIESIAGRLVQANVHNREVHLRPGFLPWFGSKKKDPPPAPTVPPKIKGKGKTKGKGKNKSKKVD